MKDYLQSQIRLRRIVGILGLALPVILLLAGRVFLSSFSHYYYTPAGIYFIAILCAFGIVLISYRGYEKEADERFSDDLITTVAGIAVLLAVRVPTGCGGSGAELDFCGDGYLFGHDDGWKGAFHLFSAGVFLFLLGYMSIFKFTRSGNPLSQKKHQIYRICGWLVWGSMIFIMIFALLEQFTDLVANEDFPYVYIGELVAVWAFSIAWLVKGKVVPESWMASNQSSIQR